MGGPSEELGRRALRLPLFDISKTAKRSLCAIFDVKQPYASPNDSSVGSSIAEVVYNP